MKIKITTGLKACYFFIAANTILAVWRYSVDDKARTVMLLAGAMMWIVCALIWSKELKEVNGE
jgi:hypothetical protein